MPLQLRLMPLSFFGLFAFFVVVTEQVGQHFYSSSNYDPLFFTAIGWSCGILIGLAWGDVWTWRLCVILWPVQLVFLGISVAVMIAGVYVGLEGEIGSFLFGEMLLTSVQVAMLAAAFFCLILPSTKAAFTRGRSSGPLANFFSYIVLAAAFILVGLGGIGTERASAVAMVVADTLVPEEEVAYAPDEIVLDGTVVELAVPAAAAYRVAHHAFAAEAAVWHGLELLEAGVAGAVPRDDAGRDASAAVLLARRGLAATFVAIEDLEAEASVALPDAAGLAGVRASLERWAGTVENATSLLAETVPLIDAEEIAPGNAAWGLVPMMVQLQDDRSRAIEQLGRLISPTLLEERVAGHFVAVSAALRDVTGLVGAFADRRGATTDLEGTAARLWDQTLPQLSPTTQSVVGLANAFERREDEFRAAIGVSLMADAFVPVVGSYQAAGGKLAMRPSNALLGLRARLLEAAQEERPPETMIVPVLRSGRQALAAVARQAALGETRMRYVLDAIGEAGA